MKKRSNPRPRWTPNGAALLFVGLVFVLMAHCSTDSHTPPTPSTYTQSIIAGKADLTHPAVGALTVSRQSPFCTATLVAPGLVLTAAHCAVAALQVGANKVSFRVDFPGPPSPFRSEYYPVQRIVVHPTYLSGQTLPAYDLGVLVLQDKVTSANPLSVLRGPMDTRWVGSPATVMGYGLIQTRPSFQTTNQKHTADIPLTQIDKQTFIQFDTKTGKSACHGDSGGPVLRQAYGRLQLIGIISAPYKATISPTPNRTYCDGGSIATRVDIHLDFLRPFLLKYNAGLLSCQDNQECVPCGSCATNGTKVCLESPVSQRSTTCQPCRSHKDCGDGLCQRFDDGFRCVQPCTKTSCCPQGSYCDTQQARVLVGQDMCVPVAQTCPTVTCQSDQDCGLDGVCKKGQCQTRSVTRHAMFCHPCYTSKQCGEGNLCINSLSSMGHCLQACTQGGICPTGTSCQQLTPGLQQCVPQQDCFPVCTDDASCPSGMTCQSGSCIRGKGGVDGDVCNTETPCESLYVCVKDQGKGRCMRRCGPPLGTAGSPCNKGSCDQGLQCISVPGQRNVCIEACTASCKVGLCLQISSQVKACVCRNDKECPQGYICNQGVLGSFGDGACILKSQLNTSCRPGQECRPNPPQGWFCGPAQGDRPAFATCSFLQRCAPNLACRQISPQHPSICYASCGPQKICGSGGLCIEEDNQQTCMCKADLNCPNGTSCVFVGSIGQSAVGYCDRSQQTRCTLSFDCPAEHRCDNGDCVFDPVRANRPFPETWPSETTAPDAGKKPSPDTESTQELDEVKTEGSQEPDASKERERNNNNLQETSPPQQGCGCYVTTERTGMSWLFWGWIMLYFGSIRKWGDGD